MYLSQHREVLAGDLRSFGLTHQRSIQLTDPFLATAILQKSLRRADGNYAHEAALALLKIDSVRLWKRLVIVACEDFGLADLDLTAKIIAAASDKAWRKSVGGDEVVVSYLVSRLLACPRDRRIDETYMLGVAISSTKDPDTSIQQISASPKLARLLREAVGVVHKCEQKLPYRGIRAVVTNECDVAIAKLIRLGGEGRALEEMCMQARRTSQCLLPVLLPLLKTSTRQQGGPLRTVTRPTPQLRSIGGLPSYALDGYTRPGRLALLTLSRQDYGLRRLLARLPTARARMDALTSLLFVVEGGVCTSELSDPLYDELKTFSLGCWSGLLGSALAEGLAIMKGAIPALNEIRADLATATDFVR